MKQKFLILAGIFCIMFTSTLAQNTAILRFEDVTIKAGEEAVMKIELLNPDDIIAGVQCDIELPQGISFKTNNKGKIVVTLNEDRKGDHVVSIAGSTPRLVSYAFPTEQFYETSGTLFEVTLVADAELASGELQASLTNIVLSDMVGNTQKPANYTGKIIVTGGDEIIDQDGNVIDAKNWPSDKVTDNKIGIYSGDKAEYQQKPNVFVPDANVQNKYVCTDLQITDGHNLVLPAALLAEGTTVVANKVTYSRPANITTDKYATVFVPYAFPADGLKVMKYTGYDPATGAVNFERAEEVEAGVPYLIRIDDVNGNAARQDANGILDLSTDAPTTITTEMVDAVNTGFYGSYQAILLKKFDTEGNQYFGYAATGQYKGEFVSAPTAPVVETNLPAFRAYFKLAVAQQSNARTSLSINFDEIGDVTGIQDNIVEVGENAEPIFSIDGIRVTKPNRGGIYIQGNRKFVVK